LKLENMKLRKGEKLALTDSDTKSIEALAVDGMKSCKNW